MKKFKKLFLLMAVVVTALVCFALSASALSSSGKCGVNVSYSYNSTTGKLVISGTGPMTDYYSSEDSPFYKSDIKSVVINNGVTTISSHAFSYCHSLTEVTLGDGVTTIGDAAFYLCKGLTEITIPDSVTTIGDSAFFLCTGITEITVDENNRYFSNDEYGVLFNKDKTTLVHYPKGNERAAYTIPDSVTTIGEDAFHSCYSLTEVIITDSVTTIGNYAFAWCSKLTEVIIPGSVTTIGDWTFSSCSKLTEVNIPDSVTTIGGYAFYSCDGLTDVYYGGTEEQWLNISIGSDNEKLTGATVHYNYCAHIDTNTDKFCDDCGKYIEKLYKSGSCGDNVTYEWYEDGMLVISGTGPMTDYKTSEASPFYESNIKSVVINNGVTTIGRYAFYSCDSLTEVTIPDSVTIIGGCAFSFCDSLAEVTIPDSVTTISSHAFYSCDSLTEVTLGNSVTTIGDLVFYLCSSLTKITIPDSVTTINFDAFLGCDSLTGITVDENNQYFSNDEYGVLFNKDKTTLIQYPTGNERTAYTIPDSVTTIGRYAFFLYTDLTEITVDENNQYFSNDEYGVLFNKDKTTLVHYPKGNERTAYTIPDSVATIGEDAFRSSSKLTEVIIPDSVTTIGNHAFAWCSELTEVIIPGSVTTIGENAFRVCSRLTEVTISDGVTTIGDETFILCSSLTEVTIPDSVTTIGDRAFYYCKSLTDVYYGGTEEQWLNISIGSNNEKLTGANIHFTCFHENKTTYAQQNATCTENGYTAGEYCPDCEKWLIEREVIPATNHNNKKTYAQQNATCTENGYTAGEYCPDCEKWLVEREVIPAINHNNKKTYAQQNASCTENGYTAGEYCPDCEKWLVEREVIPATNHNNKKTYAQQNASCTENGYTAGEYCPDCEKWISGHEVIVSVGHSFTKQVIDSEHLVAAATVESAAVYKYGCSACDAVSPDKTFAYGNALALGTTSSVTATQTTNSLTLTWANAENAAGYRIYYKLPGDVSWRTSVVYTSATTITYNKLPAGQSYRFAIRSAYKKADGTYILGGYKEIGTATRAVAPANVDSLQSDSAIRLNWTACTGATGYRIYYKSGNIWKVCVSTTAATSHTFNNLKPGSKYTFAVRPYILVDGVVIWSDYITITTATQTISPVVTLTSTSKGQINLSWKAVNGAEQYQVYYKVGNGNYKLYKTYTSAQSLKFINLKSGTKYTFAVRGVIKGSEENIYGFHSPVSVTVK